jgi:hypothetical protein
METQHKFFEQSSQEWAGAISETIGRALLEKWRERESDEQVESPWQILGFHL